MPSKTPAQHRLMAMVAHDPKAAKRVGIPQSVGKDFMAADKGRKFSKGGDMATKGKNPFAGKESKSEESAERKKFPSKKAYAAAESKMEGEKMPKFARGGGVETKGKTRGKMVTMARGGKCK